MDNKLEKGMNSVGSIIYIVPTGSNLKDKNGIFDPSQKDPLTGEPIGKIKCMRIVDGAKRGRIGVYDMQEIDPSTHHPVNDSIITMPMNGEQAYSLNGGKDIINRGWDFYDSMEGAKEAIMDIGRKAHHAKIAINSVALSVDIEVDEELTEYQRRQVIESISEISEYTNYSSTIFKVNIDVFLDRDTMPEIKRKVEKIKENIAGTLLRLAVFQKSEFDISIQQMKKEMKEKNGDIMDGPQMTRYILNSDDDLLKDVAFVETDKKGIYAFIAKDSTERTLGYALLDKDDIFLEVSKDYKDIEKKIQETKGPKISSSMDNTQDTDSNLKITQ